MSETLGDRVRMHRARLRLTQKGLAEKVGLSVMGISNIENGNVDPRGSKVSALAKALGVTTDYLLGQEYEESEMLPRESALVSATD